MLPVLFLSLCLIGVQSDSLPLTSSLDNDNCVFESAGYSFNLSTLVNPVFDLGIGDGRFSYVYNFCQGTKNHGNETYGWCRAGETAICAFDSYYGGRYTSVGLIDSVTYENLPTGFMATYRNETGSIAATVTFICAPGITSPTFGAPQQSDYVELSIWTAMACGTPPPPPAAPPAKCEFQDGDEHSRSVYERGWGLPQLGSTIQPLARL
eukprot:m.167167 g.167167  ORF g.167167 m.167167 type:complete len:209 (+) comp25034_c0_seq2:73-699(+)